MKNISAENLFIGKNSFVDPTAIIRGIDGKAKNIFIGDNVYIGANVQIICDTFSIGDYSKLQHNITIHGYKPCRIGHNAWIGQYSIIDTIGGTKIGNNCGIGAHSQIWSHIKFGDTLEGCRFLSEKEMNIGNDVWFVGHCIVSPINAADKSMAMVGSVITKDMAYNEIYAGSPAISISQKIGHQFENISLEMKYNILSNYLSEFKEMFDLGEKIKIVKNIKEINFKDEFTYFDISTRTYKKTLSQEEVLFMKYLLPSRAKFIPLTNDTIQ